MYCRRAGRKGRRRGGWEADGVKEKKEGGLRDSEN
jgi:hypothetical protein